jgi:hypothetical protein
MSNEQGRRIDDKRSQEAVDWSEVREVLSSHPMPAQATVDLSGLTRYNYAGYFCYKSPIGEYLRFDDVQALLSGAASAPAQAAATEQATEELNGGMHASIFVKVWGDAGGGDAGRIALANYAYALGKRDAFATPADAGAGQALTPEALDEWLPDMMAEWMAAPRGEAAYKVYERIERRVMEFVGQSPAPVTADAGAAAPVSRDAVLEEVAEKIEAMNDSAGDRAAYENRDMHCCEETRMWALKDCADGIRALKSRPVAAAAGEDSRDTARLDWLQGHMLKMMGDLSLSLGKIEGRKPFQLFGQKVSYDTLREAIDAAMSPPSPVESAKQGGSE